MNTTLGLDLGTNSIGWAIRNANLDTTQIEKIGVLTFNKGVGKDKSGEYSFAAKRTKKRSTRRLYQARKYRLWDTLKYLIDDGYCPLTIENLDKWRKYNKEEATKNNNGGRVYPVEDLRFDAWVKLDFDGDGKPDYTSLFQLRKELAEIKLDLEKEDARFKIGRALYHIAQRRGFKSSRKGTDDIKEKEFTDENKETEEITLIYSEKKKNKTITELFEKYSDAKTIGWLFANLENDKIRVRENIAQYAIRENYKDEIKYIFEKQGINKESTLYKNVVETGHNKNDGSIFYKRALRSQKGLIGKCPLEPTKYRVPLSHPSFETFRAWSILNNIKFKAKNSNDSFEQIPFELRQKLFNKFFIGRVKAYFTIGELAEYIETVEGKNWQLNYNWKTSVSACPVSARLKDIFGDDFLTIKIKSDSAKKGHYDIDDIWHIFFNYEDQEYVQDFAQLKLGLDDAKTKKFITAWNATPVGYGMLSINAINKINVFLEKGLIYTEAVLLANIPNIIGKELWAKNETLLISEIGNLIDKNREQKNILGIVNGLIAKYKNLDNHKKFGYKDDGYKLKESDKEDVKKQIFENIGEKKWTQKSIEEQIKINEIISVCYQAFFSNKGLEIKYFGDDKHFIIKIHGENYYKTETGFYKMPRLIDTLANFLVGNFDLNEKDIAKIYHPSEINIYPPAKEDKDGNLRLGSPKTGSFKNPMAMRTLHELRRLTNYLIDTKQIDTETRVVVEVGRELNDANKRWAIEAWQKQREEENKEYALVIQELLGDNGCKENYAVSNDEIDKFRIWYEQNDELNIPEVLEIKEERGKKKVPKDFNTHTKKWSDSIKDSYKAIKKETDRIKKYRLWLEQDCKCIYTGKVISITDLFNDNTIDFEHTLPLSQSFDNSLANLTVCFHDFNRTVKKQSIPYNLPNYDKSATINGKNYSAILPRLEKWLDKVKRIEQQIEFWKAKSKKTADKKWKDDAIRQRHLWQMELDYWKNKVERFTIKEITSGFKNSQLVDTQLISKYAFHYLKTYFDKVDVQKGSITSDFRKIYGLQVADEKKDRSKHSHHAKDAAVLTLIPVAIKRESILKEYYEHKERNQKYNAQSPYKGFNRDEIWNIDDTILINNIAKDQALTPAKRIVRKRGKVQLIEGTNQPKIATGDCIRGQLHDETFFGAIKPAKLDEKGKLQRKKNGTIIQEDKLKFVVRVAMKYKKNDQDAEGSFKNLEHLKSLIVDKILFKQIEKQVHEVYNGSLKDALEGGVWMLNRKGEMVNKIRHIRVFKDVSEPLVIKQQTYKSKLDYKNNYYAGNASNIAYGLYKSENKESFKSKIINLLTASNINKLTGSNILELELNFIEKKEKFNLLAILKSGQKVIFYNQNKNELFDLSIKELSNLIYVIDGFEKDGRIRFSHHLNALNNTELKELADLRYGKDKFKALYQGCSSLNTESPWPKLKLSMGNLKMCIEYIDFEIKIDGTIKFND